jgi:predicted secreted protein
MEAAMSAFTGAAMYMIIWWVVLLAVIPIFTRPVAAPDPASGWRGLPQRVRFGKIVLVTTLVAAVIWVGADLLINSPWMSFRSGPWALPMD